MNPTRPTSLMALILAMCLHTPGAAASEKPRFRIEPIPFPADNSVREITPYDLNDDGMVVGACQISPGANGIRPFRASIAGGFVRLPHPDGSGQSRAVAINARGHIVGWEMTGSGFYAPIAPVGWKPSGSLRRLPGGDGDKVFPVDINRSGAVAGQRHRGSDEQGWIAVPGGDMRLIGGLDGDQSNPTAINDLGWVVGSSPALMPTGKVGRHAFLWRPGVGIVDIGVDIGESASGATGINNKGTVIGHYYSESQPLRAFVWTADTGLIPMFKGETGESWASGINDHHWITGNRDGIGFLRTPEHGTMAIDDLVDPQDPNLGRVGALLPGSINRLGQIVASTTVDGRPWAVLLTPIQSPPGP